MADATPYPDINAVLHTLLTSTGEVLGERFVGLYLYGSLASGGFDPETSILISSSLLRMKFGTN